MSIGIGNNQANAFEPLAAVTGDWQDHTPVLVVGLDGSGTSWAAFSWACGESRRLEGRIVAVFVTPSVFPSTAVLPAVDIVDCSAMQEAATEQAAQLRTQAREVGEDLDLSFVHVRGDAATELVRIATTIHADVIVVGRSTKVRHHLVGALGGRLISKRGAPVVVVVP
jgi:nucleotide-binding universal stress UspA family protein